MSAGPSCTFIADCRPEQGFGHLRRCLALASALAAEGVACEFWGPAGMASPLPADTIAGWRAGRLTADTLPPAADIVVVDSYMISDASLAALKAEAGMVVLIDDLGQRAAHCDIYLNHNVFAPKLTLTHIQASLRLLGPDYALIDPRFATLRNRPKGRGILVSFGGTDDGSRALALVSALGRLAEDLPTFHIPVPSHVTPAAAFRDLAGHRDAVRLHHGVDMVALMNECRVYIGAAGHASLEAAAAGLHVLICVIAENQRTNAQALSELGAVLIDPSQASTVLRAIRECTCMAASGLASAIDGSGAARAASAIVKNLAGFLNPSIRRPADGNEAWSG